MSQQIDGPEVETRRSYRWQIAAADAAALTLAVTGRGNVLLASASIYLFDGLVIHAAHGEVGRAVGSVALRAALPILGAYIGGGIWWRSQDSRCRAGDSEFCSDDEFNVGALLGLGVGLLTAVVADTAFVARPVAVRKPRAAAWAPRVSATHHGVSFGFASRF